MVFVWISIGTTNWWSSWYTDSEVCDAHQRPNNTMIQVTQKFTWVIRLLNFMFYVKFCASRYKCRMFGIPWSSGQPSFILTLRGRALQVRSLYANKYTMNFIGNCEKLLQATRYHGLVTDKLFFMFHCLSSTVFEKGSSKSWSFCEVFQIRKS